MSLTRRVYMASIIGIAAVRAIWRVLRDRIDEPIQDEDAEIAARFRQWYGGGPSA